MPVRTARASSVLAERATWAISLENSSALSVADAAPSAGVRRAGKSSSIIRRSSKLARPQRMCRDSPAVSSSTASFGSRCTTLLSSLPLTRAPPSRSPWTLRVSSLSTCPLVDDIVSWSPARLSLMPAMAGKLTRSPTVRWTHLMASSNSVRSARNFMGLSLGCPRLDGPAVGGWFLGMNELLL